MNLLARSLTRLVSRRRSLESIFVALLIAACDVPSLAQTAGASGVSAPAQFPLLSRAGASVKPNLMITLDDSTSMGYQHMPDVAARVGKYRVTFPINVNPIPGTSQPREFQPYFDPDTAQGRQAFGDMLISGVPGSRRVEQRYLRSPDVNSIYYNPEIQYRPWIRADGTRYPQARFTAAADDPDLPKGYIDLSNVRKMNTNWCFHDNASKSSNVCHPGAQDYDPGLWYRLRTNGGEYLDPAVVDNYDEFSVNSGNRFTRYANRRDCAGTTVCTQAEERQNFANWFVYYRSRMLLTKGALAEAMASLDDVLRIGWGRINDGEFNDIDGTSLPIISSGVRDWVGNKRPFYDWLRGVVPNGGTPLRLAMQVVAAYYASSATSGPWSDTPGARAKTDEKTCRRAYHALLTDGYANDTPGQRGLRAVGNQDNPPPEAPPPVITGPGNQRYQYVSASPYKDANVDMLADYAMKFWLNDLRPDLDNNVAATPSNPAFWQHMTNFTVGLGVRGNLDPATDLPALTRGEKAWTRNEFDDLWHAAINSRGAYFSARNPLELTAAMQSILRSSIERELREAGVATAASVLETGNRKYVPRYRSGSWSGDVEAYVLDEQGQAGVLAWSAKDQLPAWQMRNIATWDSGIVPARGVAFTANALSASAKAVFPSSGASALIDYVRGDRSGEDAIGGLRVRDSILGDFVNSTPVFARAATDADYYRLPDLGEAYGRYVVNTKANRDGVLYVGANDGMLHAFRETRGRLPQQDGREIFAYVPQAVHGQLFQLGARDYGSAVNYHRFFVDGPLREADVYVGNSWRNWLFGSTGAGARAVFAIDITDPSALGPSSVRWEISASSYPELGFITFPVETGMLPNGTWVAVFGNGYGGASGQAVLFVVELATGKVQQLPVGGAGGNGLGGVAVVRNGDGTIASLYAGDQRGQLWRFDYANGASSGLVVAIEGRPLFDAGIGKPIVQPPAVFQQSAGVRFVVFGTGRLLTESDAADATVQTLYGVSDRLVETAPATPSPGWSASFPKGPDSLQARTISALEKSDYFTIQGDPIDWARQRGWKIDLALAGYSGLRVVFAPQKANERYVFVGAVAPVRDSQPCGVAQGNGLNLLFPALDGLADTRPVFDVDRNGVIDSMDKPSAGYATGADGQDRMMVASTTQTSDGLLVIRVSLQNTAGQTAANLYDKAAANLRIKGRIWRRIANPPIQ